MCALFIKIQYLFFSPLVWLLLMIKGVKCRGRNYWNGIPSIKKGRNSVISIGAECRFSCGSASNRIGLYHTSMLTTEVDAILEIGRGCGFSGVSIWCFKRIVIGNNVRVGANVTIMDGDAHQDDPRAGKNKDILIEDNVWIGANTMVMKGVTIGRNTLIGAGSIVTKDIPSNVIAAGNPCKVIRELNEETVKRLTI